ncbi:GNAT family N-acetyltransferase [Archangium primigenium]|nr:GNAT family N-acetyltransferase [Archangium primigenium]
MLSTRERTGTASPEDMTNAELHARLRLNLLELKRLQWRTGSLVAWDAPGVLAVGLPAGSPSMQQQVLYAWPEALAPALADVEAWYLARGVRTWRVAVTPGDTAAEHALGAAGYQPHGAIGAMGRALPPHAPVCPPEGITLERPDDLDALLTLNAGCYEPGSMDYLATWRRAPLPASGVHAVLARESGQPLACAMSFEHAGCAGLYMVATHPRARRRGLGALVVQALQEDARARGCTHGVLQSSPDGASLYPRLGYRDLGDWVNWVRRVP